MRLFTPRSVSRHSLPLLSAAAILAACSFNTAAAMALDDDDVLRGPRVRESAPPGGPDFSQEKDRFMRAADAPVPLRMFVQAVRSLAPERAPEGLALTPEQAEAIRVIQQAHTSAVAEYFQKNRAEIEALLAKADLPQPPMGGEGEGQGRPGRPGRGEGAGDGAGDGQGRPARPANPDAGEMTDDRPERARRGRGPAEGQPAGGPNGLDAQAPNRDMARLTRAMAILGSDRLPPSQDPEANAARTRLIELRDAAPSPDEPRAMIWAQLDPAQQAHVTATIEKARAQAQERMREREQTRAQNPETRGGRPGASPEADPGDRRPAPGQQPRRGPSPDA